MPSTTPIPHPFDPLSREEIEATISIVKKAHGNDLLFNEPRKADMTAWLANPEKAPRPSRIADAVAIGPDGKVYDGLINLQTRSIVSWEVLDGLQPIITIEELQLVEHIVRKDPKVIEQCKISGIAEEDMDKVYCDPWTIGYDERYGSKVRLQQALMYYRPNKEIISIDIPKIRRPLSKAPAVNYHPEGVEKQGGFRKDLKTINITQPEGVSFKMTGRQIEWQNWKFHIGFNYREGIVLNNITFNDKGTERPIFYRLSLVEMVVP
ncbi:unnamed protein product [Parascedosporium putredinis]|uniref:Amine oxidase n=1 Tax=Parascedosporium putredinis TaxID=1442378 RepID=A0A9P1GXA8_9PEZI|nr:unnamed protein product [Parascedosporium putredinis]CAI7990385.1 unnamed protein product [Parascedosporium putredinis]